MGVSFKVSKIGTRFRPKPVPLSENDEGAGPTSQRPKEISRTLPRREDDMAEKTNSSTGSVGPILPEHEVSFTLSLYETGYVIGKPTEADQFMQDGKPLHPYDRASENLFSAIESGWLPGDILDDIPSKYYNGSVFCEVRDYRKSVLEQRANIPAENRIPVVNKIRLRMSLENVVKDIPLISDDSWTYSDFMEVESRIVKALQPRLCLDPTPRLDRLCTDPVPTKLNLIVPRRKRRPPEETPEVVVVTAGPHGKKVCIDRPPASEAASSQHQQHQQHQLQQNIPENMQQNLPGGPQQLYRQNSNFSQEASRMSLPPPALSSHNYPNFSQKNLPGSYPPDSFNSGNLPISSIKRENQDVGQLLPNNMEMKRPRQNITMEDLQQQHQHQQMRAPLAGLSQQQLQQYAAVAAVTGQRFAPAAAQDSFYLTQGMRYGAGTSPGIGIGTGIVKDEQKRKGVNSPRVQSGPTVQSPVSSKSGGEMSSGSMQRESKPLTAAANQGMPGGSGGQLAASSPGGESMQHRMHPAAAGKRKGGQKGAQAGTASGAVGSPASVSNVSAAAAAAQLNASSPSVGTAGPVAGVGSGFAGDVLERFAKIEAVTVRYQLNMKKIKSENIQRKPTAYPSQQEVVSHLSNSLSAEDFKDPYWLLSRSLIGGSMATHKSRVMHFLRPPSPFPGVSANPHYQLMLMEKPYDGTVGMQHGDTEDPDNPNPPQCPLTLPTSYYADLLASQFSRLMERDGYVKKEDQIRLLPILMVNNSNTADSTGGTDSKLPELPPGQSSSIAAAAAPATNMGPLGPAMSNRILPPGNSSPALSVPQGYLPPNAAGMQMQARSQSQQLDPMSLQQQQQQQQLQQTNLPPQQIQRSAAGPILSHMMGGAGPTKTTSLQIQMMQQQQQQQQQVQQQQIQPQQQQQQQRKVMVGLGSPMGNISNMGNMGNIGMGSIGNMGNMGNMGNISGLTNVMGMGNVRGMAGVMGNMGNLGNMGLNQMNLGLAGIRPGSMTQAQQASLAKFRLAHQQRSAAAAAAAATGMYGLQSGGLGSGGLSMMGLNRANMSPLHRTSMTSPMGPPKFPAGHNMYLNPQQQMQLQQQQQQQQQQLQQGPHQNQMQQIGSPLQQGGQVGSPPAVGSQQSGGMIMQQQPQISQQQVSQLTAMSSQQMSAGAVQQVSNSNNNNNNVNTTTTTNNNNISGGGNVGTAPPASPQLSSQTHGSVGSITSSPMEQLQGANKGGPAGNI